MAATDARPVPRKGVAYRVTFALFDADGDLVTAAAGLDSEVSKDAGTFADCTNEATEIATSSGMYYLDLTATEMDADTVAVIVKTSTSGAKTTPIVLYPEEVGDYRVNVEQFGGTNGTFSAGRPEVNTTHAAGTAWGSGAITAASIAADAITAAKIADGAIDAGAIASDAITAAKIADGAIDAATFAAGAINAAAIADGAIDAATFAAGAINAAAIAADAITAAKVATGAIDADALATDAVTEIADGILDRNMATGTDSGSPTVRTVRQAMRALRNKVSIAAGTATITKEDDSTASWTAAVTTTAGDPISEIDPASA